jgi:hypothetical protein
MLKSHSFNGLTPEPVHFKTNVVMAEEKNVALLMGNIHLDGVSHKVNGTENEILPIRKACRSLRSQAAIF